MPVARAPRIYFSLRSPYSWLACRDLVDQHAAIAESLEWVPFWEPDDRNGDVLTRAGGHWAYTPMSREKHLYILQDVRRLARARGLTLTWPVDRNPVWEVPHLAYLYAQSQGMGRSFLDRVQRARWQEGQDICQPAVIGALAAELGLSPLVAATAWQDDQWRDMGIVPLMRACDDGVFGVPFIVYGRQKFWGVDRIPAFVQALAGHSQAVLVPEDVRPVAANAFDGGHEGGCG